MIKVINSFMTITNPDTILSENELPSSENKTADGQKFSYGLMVGNHYLKSCIVGWRISRSFVKMMACQAILTLPDEQHVKPYK